jgi:hypothetical protein
VALGTCGRKQMLAIAAKIAIKKKENASMELRSDIFFF